MKGGIVIGEPADPPDFIPCNSDRSTPRHRSCLPPRPGTPGEALKYSREEAGSSLDHRDQFRKKHYPMVSDLQWNDWSWQLQNRITDSSRLEQVINLTVDEINTQRSMKGRIPVGITPYYASLIISGDPKDPIRRCVIPTGDEMILSPGEAGDPLGEEGSCPTPCIVHRYPDRVLFLATDFCSVNCRYCTRSRLVGRSGERCAGRNNHLTGVDYIRRNPQIRDVLISGGDPLTLPDEYLDWLLKELSSIEHVEILRIGTKVPAVLPQRITQDLVSILRRYHPLWMSLHFTHPREITRETTLACNMLADGGIPLGSQTVLLSGINDDLETLRQLFHLLLKNRVRPYYLYQCDPIPGSAHFRTPVQKGPDIIRGLRGHTTGYGVPQFVVDAPGGGGKIPLMPQYEAGRDGDDLLLYNYEGKIFRYPDPRPSADESCILIGRSE